MCLPSQLSTPSPLQLAFNAWNESTAWLPEVVRFSVTAAFCSQLHTLWTEPCAAIQLTTLRNWPVLAEEVTAWLNDSDFNVRDFFPSFHPKNNLNLALQKATFFTNQVLSKTASPLSIQDRSNSHSALKVASHIRRWALRLVFKMTI